MRSHFQILTDAGGADAIHAKGIGGTLNTVRSWVQRKRIPALAFADFMAAGLATFDELSDGARALSKSRIGSDQSAAA